MLYISTQLSCKWPRKTRPIECSWTLPQPSPPQPGLSQTLRWTDANLVMLEQIFKDLGISEKELDLCMFITPAQFQANVLRTPESPPRKATACPKKARIKSRKAAVPPILGRINAPRLPNKRYQKLQPPTLRERSQSAIASPTRFSTAIAVT